MEHDITSNGITTQDYEHHLLNGMSDSPYQNNPLQQRNDNEDQSDITTDDVNQTDSRDTSPSPTSPRRSRQEEAMSRRALLTDEDILRRLPRSRTNNQNDVQRLLECQVTGCTKAATKECVGYCSAHFCDLYRNGQIDIPSPGSLDEAAARGCDVATSSDDQRHREPGYPVHRNTTSGSGENSPSSPREERRRTQRLTRTRSSGCASRYEGSSGSGSEDEHQGPQKCVGNMCNKTTRSGPLCDDCLHILKKAKKPKKAKSYPCAFRKCPNRTYEKDTLCKSCREHLSKERARRTPIPRPNEVYPARSETGSPTLHPAPPARCSATLHPEPERKDESVRPRTGRSTLHPSPPRRDERTRTGSSTLHPMPSPTYKPARTTQRSPRAHDDRARDAPRQSQYRDQDRYRRDEYSPRRHQRYREWSESLERDREHQLSLQFEHEPRHYHHHHRRVDTEFDQSQRHRGHGNHAPPKETRNESPPNSLMSETNTHSVESEYDRKRPRSGPHRDHRKSTSGQHRSRQPEHDRSRQTRIHRAPEGTPRFEPESQPSSFISEANTCSVESGLHLHPFREDRPPRDDHPPKRKSGMHSSGRRGSHERQYESSGNEYSSVANIPPRNSCRNRECSNYGNEKCDGLCNSCFSKLRR